MNWKYDPDFRDDDDRERQLNVALVKTSQALKDACEMLDHKFRSPRWRREYTFDQTIRMADAVANAIGWNCWDQATQAVHPLLKGEQP